MANPTESQPHVALPPRGGRVAVVGTGSRAAMFIRGVVARSNSSDPAAPRIVAFCEPNSIRAAYHNELLGSLLSSTSPGSNPTPVPVYKPAEFEEMLEKEKVDTVVICCVDSEHDVYIVRALQFGYERMQKNKALGQGGGEVRVITEKPMTTDVEKCRRILKACRDTSRGVEVTFNYRYNPVHELVKRTIASGEIGDVLSIHFEWLLDTVHGADYFRRWHRLKSSSGGLMIHKSGHHFDLVNWWIGNGAYPVTVAGMGKLAFYGKENGDKSGWGKGRDWERGRTVGDRSGADYKAKEDRWGIDLEGGEKGDGETLKRLYADAEVEDGYFRDQNVFGSGIGIEDDMSLLVKYNTGTTMTYHLTAYSPWEGYHVMFNGSLGRLELEVIESTHRDPPAAATSESSSMEGLIHGNQALKNAGGVSVTLQKLWDKPVKLPAVVDHAAHGGGDTRMLNALFGSVNKNSPVGDAEKQSANERDGALALAVGLMANESFKTGRFVNLEELNLGLDGI